MLAKIMSEMPLPMPRWVISSPSHMTMTAPTVSVSTTMTTLRSVKVELPAASTGKAPWLRNRKTKPMASMSARTAVKYRVYWLTFFCPAGPSFMRASSFGLTMVSSCMMIDAVM